MANADNRSVATDALATLGTIIDDKQKRDAIHLAVEPVIAGENLMRGEHITVANGIAVAAKTGKGLGIVDPFLPHGVKEGERFWFVMYPRMVHSLRHVWTHPAFPDEPGTWQSVMGVSSAVPDKTVSEAWLRQYAKRVNPYLADNGDDAYTTLMNDIRRGELTYHGIDMHSFGDLLDADELQRHASIVLGRPVIWGDFEYFSCTC